MADNAAPRRQPSELDAGEILGYVWARVGDFAVQLPYRREDVATLPDGTDVAQVNVLDPDGRPHHLAIPLVPIIPLAGPEIDTEASHPISSAADEPTASGRAAQWTEDDLQELDRLAGQLDESIAKSQDWERRPAPLRWLTFWQR